MRNRGLLLLVLVVAITAVFVSRRSAEPAKASMAQAAPPPWSLQPSDSGMTFTWDRTTPALRDARTVELIVHDGKRAATHVLDRSSGTLIIPYTPQLALLRINGQSQTIYGREAAPAPVAPAASPVVAAAAVPAKSRVSFPMLLSNRSQRVVSSATVVMPRVPDYVHRTFDVELYVKVSPRGKVASVASNYPHDPLRNRLSAVASDAIAQWQFDPIRVNSYRDVRVRLVFTPHGVSVRPVSVG